MAIYFATLNVISLALSAYYNMCSGEKIIMDILPQ